ncbi:zinc-binding alcohol dehydrogenase family protein [Nocardia sp. NPDC051570]|uniref:zinc-binding alcohol dehydrogenase family protein n=1 Tax=Nocardia sp. NPDC051570 TaxID=3364324 RepID=UPI003794CC16
MRAVQITEFGGPEVLTLTEVPEPIPGPRQLLVKVDRAGINYADTHATENSYLAPMRLPMVPGSEVVGDTADGRRVVALTDGGYAEYAVVLPHLAFGVPEGVSDAAALALIIQGATAWHMLRTCAHLTPGESVLVHSAAGGVGSLAVQLAKLWGAGRVIATASSPEKRELAVRLGADIAIDGTPEGLSERIRDANHGQRVDIVLEMVGGTVFDESLDALDSFGRLVAYGAASRTNGSPVPPGALIARSKAVIGFWLQDCFRRPPMMTEAMTDLFDLVVAGALTPQLGGDYPMSEVIRAHQDLRSRRTIGKLVLDPSR